jgi:hypothetical protein
MNSELYTKVTAKPSILLRFMHEGLVTASKGECRMIIDMGVFAQADAEGQCFGCAATAALMAATGKELDKDRLYGALRAGSYGLRVIEMSNIESALDHARLGMGDALFRLCNCEADPDPYFRAAPYLKTENYIWKLPRLLELVERLEANGL